MNNRNNSNNSYISHNLYTMELNRQVYQTRVYFDDDRFFDMSLVESISNAILLYTSQNRYIRDVSISYINCHPVGIIYVSNKARYIINNISKSLKKHLSTCDDLQNRNTKSIIQNICNTCNVHIAIYSVETFMDKETENQILGAKLGDQILNIKPNNTNLNEGYNYYPLKISLAYWKDQKTKNYHHYKEAYTLICSMTDHTPSLYNLCYNYYSMYRGDMIRLVALYQYNPAMSLESIANDVVNFVFKDDEKENANTSTETGTNTDTDISNNTNGNGIMKMYERDYNSILNNKPNNPNNSNNKVIEFMAHEAMHYISREMYELIMQ